MNDILLDEDYNMRIEDEDFVVGESTSQEMKLILKADKAQFITAPLIGYGVDKRMNGSIDKLQEAKEIRTNLEADNIRVDDIIIQGENDNYEIEIDGDRKK